LHTKRWTLEATAASCLRGIFAPDEWPGAVSMVNCWGYANTVFWP